MTLKQGDDINKSFTTYQKKIDSLKDSVKIKRYIYDSLIIELNKIDKTNGGVLKPSVFQIQYFLTVTY